MRPTTLAALVLLACAPRVPAASSAVDERAPRWAEWVSRVEALPVCLPPELEAAPRELPSLAPGDTVQVRGHLGLVEYDCSDLLNELVIRGRWLPAPGAVLSLREIDDAVAHSERDICGSLLGVSAGAVEFALESPSPRAWKQNDAELFDELLARTDAVLVGVVEVVRNQQAVVQPTRLCRAPGPTLELMRLPDDGVRWKMLDGLEHLSNLPTISRTRRAQALRVLYDLTARTDPPRARTAAERLVNEFGDRSRVERPR